MSSTLLLLLVELMGVAFLVGCLMLYLFGIVDATGGVANRVAWWIVWGVVGIGFSFGISMLKRLVSSDFLE